MSPVGHGDKDNDFDPLSRDYPSHLFLPKERQSIRWPLSADLKGPFLDEGCQPLCRAPPYVHDRARDKGHAWTTEKYAEWNQTWKTPKEYTQELTGSGGAA